MFRESAPVDSTFAAGQPIDGASVLALFPRGTFSDPITTDKGGDARSDMPCAQKAMTVFVATLRFAALVKYHWLSAEHTLVVELYALTICGFVVFPKVWGGILGLEEPLGSFEINISGPGSKARTSPSMARTAQWLNSRLVRGHAVLPKVEN